MILPNSANQLEKKGNGNETEVWASALHRVEGAGFFFLSKGRETLNPKGPKSNYY